jgi:DNA-binding transcriptional ArsR family regulator
MPTKQDVEHTAWLFAIAEPTRLAIVRALVGRPKTVTELAAMMKVKMGSASHHLKILRSAGLVESERGGQLVTNSLVGGKVTGAKMELTHPSGAMLVLPME